MAIRSIALAAAAAVAACSAPTAPAGQESSNQAAAAPQAPLPSVEPPAPGTAGGLPDDRTPVSEAPFAATSAQGAANVVQTYYALLEEGRDAEARRWWSGGKAGGAAPDLDRSAADSEYHAQIGAPGAVEGAAGSLYVEVPVVIYGRRKDGAAFSRKAVVTLRRVNDVPGSSAEDRKWHIRTIADAADGGRPG
jgi:hypothetical protein